MTKRFMATMRLMFHAEDEIEARLIANEIEEKVDLDEGDDLDVTQVIPYDEHAKVEPTELVNQLRLCVDMLIKTRIVQCFDQARELHKIAWILEHRTEETFDLTGYDYGAIMDRTAELLGRKREGT